MIFSKQTTFIGLDINTTHLNWLQVVQTTSIPFAFQVATRREHSRGAECTDTYMSTEASSQRSRGLKGEGYIKIKNYGKIDFVEKNDKGFPENLNVLIEKQKFKQGYVGISLKEPTVKTANITIPANLTNRVIKKLLQERASCLFNQPVTNLCFHYQLLRSPKYQSELNFMIAVIEKKTIQTWITYFRKSPLRLKVIDMSVFASDRGEKTISQQNFLLDPMLNQTDFLNQINLFTACLGLAVRP